MIDLAGSLVDAATGGVAGSLIGAIGGVVNKWQDNKHAQSMANSELAKLSAANTLQLELAKLNRDVDTVKSETETLVASYTAESTSISAGKDSKLLEIADFIRMLTRPVLTALLLFASGLLAMYLLSVYGSKLTVDQAHIILMHLVVMLVTSTGLAIGWWFGSRKAGG